MKLFNSGGMKPERIAQFKQLLELCERYRRKSQYESRCLYDIKTYIDKLSNH